MQLGNRGSRTRCGEEQRQKKEDANCMESMYSTHHDDDDDADEGGADGEWWLGELEESRRRRTVFLVERELKDNPKKVNVAILSRECKWEPLACFAFVLTVPILTLVVQDSNSCFNKQLIALSILCV
jgi:hypothetical protein